MEGRTDKTSHQTQSNGPKILLTPRASLRKPLCSTNDNSIHIQPDLQDHSKWTITDKASTSYDKARQLFKSATGPTRLIGRETERVALHSFIKRAIAEGRGGSLYISGPPGTGKSALLNEVVTAWESKAHFHVLSLNCMGLLSADQALNEIHAVRTRTASKKVEDGEKECDGRDSSHSKKDRSLPYLVILDEIDNLLFTDPAILQRIFEMSMDEQAQMAVIGTANLLDLTDRHLPRLKAVNARPYLLPFPPYTPQQISNIIRTKLKSLLPEDIDAADEDVPFFQPAAIELCSRKVASQSGDLRIAFDILTRVIDTLETVSGHRRKTLIAQSDCPSSNPLTSSSDFVAAKDKSFIKKASIPDVCRAFTSLSRCCHVERLKALHLHQRVVLWSILDFQFNRHRRRQKSFSKYHPNHHSDPCGKRYASVRSLLRFYHNFCCENDKIEPVSNSEFLDIISGLESAGLVRRESRRQHSNVFLASQKSQNLSEDSCIISLINEQDFQICYKDPTGAVLDSLLTESKITR